MAGDAEEARPQRPVVPGVNGASDAPPSYVAPRWLPGGHLQTLYAALYAPRPRVAYTRTRWETPDSDFVDVDFVDPRTPSERAGQPLVVLFHGLEGSSRSHYASALMAHVAARRLRGAVVHFRGCSGEPNRLPRAYHSGDTTELDWMLRRLRAECADAPLHIVGVSLGGNVLLKWLGERGNEAQDVINSAAAVSAPVDLMACGNALDRGLNLIYTYAFLSTLKKKSLSKLVQHPGIYDPARVRAARTLRAFDDTVTAPLHGFLGTDDYWTRASSKPHLKSIALPTLVLNARNDPFLPPTALPTPGEVSRSVTLECPSEGGHVGFVQGPYPGNLDWLPQRLLSFFRIGQ